MFKDILQQKTTATKYQDVTDFDDALT